MGSLRASGFFVGGICLFTLIEAAQGGTPANDSFANRSLLSGNTNFVLASNVGASTEPNEGQHADAPGGSSVWWSWTAPNSETFCVSTEGSSFDTLLGVYYGNALTNLIQVASNDDSGNNGTSRVIFRAIAGETYQIAVDGFLGDNGDIVLQLGPSGYSAPAWTLSTATNTVVSSSAFRNKVVLVDFFETVCTACTEETPALIYLQSLHRRDGFEVVGMAKDNSIANIVYNTRSLGINYTVVVNQPSVEASFGGPVMAPTKFLIDREGRIQMKLVGANSLYDYTRIILPMIRGAAKLPLNIRRENNRVTLAWPATEFGWTAESATAPNATWFPLADPVDNGNVENIVTFPASDPIRLFRLRKPW